ncbi:MAG: alpha-glucosidase [Bradyrhizobium sp.]|jgi:alpha-glucosidase
MQARVHNKTRPENPAFLIRLRTLLDEFGAVGAGDSLAVMAQYTAGGDKLQLATRFNLLTSAAQFCPPHSCVAPHANATCA